MPPLDKAYASVASVVLIGVGALEVSRGADVMTTSRHVDQILFIVSGSGARWFGFRQL